MPKTPEEVLNEAAQAARALIPSAEGEVEQAHKALAIAQARLNHLKTLAAMTSTVSSVSLGSVPSRVGTVTTSISTSSGNVFSYTSSNSTLPVREKISLILSAAQRREPGSRVSLSPKAIADQIETTFGEQIPPSTLYAALSSGRQLGLFSEESGLWTLRQSEGQG